MSVLIKGVEMPNNCKECPFSDHEAWCLIPGDWRERYYCPDDERSEFCPLIEVPTPHGRLIDADEFEREFNNHLLPILVKKYGEEEALKGLHFSFRDCICNIQCQKTVIEGSEE